MAVDGSRKAVIAALLANTGIAVAKFVAFAFTRSSAMLAEGVHSVADASNQALLLLGVSRAQRPPTPEHPFGYGRERFFWSFVVAIVLFALGSLFALFEGVEKLRHPHGLSSPLWAVGVLVVGIALETGSFRVAIREADRTRADRSWSQFIRHATTPELPVVLLEDAGALIGLVLALAGVGLVVITGQPVWDGVATVAIGLLLGVISIVLAREMKSLLIGEGAAPNVVARIRAALEATPAVERVVHMRTQYLGPEELLVAAKVDLGEGQSLAEVAAAIDAAEERMRAAAPEARMIYLEPGAQADHHEVEPGAESHDQERAPREGAP